MRGRLERSIIADKLREMAALLEAQNADGIWPRHFAVRRQETGDLPYASNDDLPQSLRLHLPPHAQDIYRAAFNNAWSEYGAREPERREEIAHRVAWAAVKRRYRKENGCWVDRDNE